MMLPTYKDTAEGVENLRRKSYPIQWKIGQLFCFVWLIKGQREGRLFIDDEKGDMKGTKTRHKCRLGRLFSLTYRRIFLYNGKKAEETTCVGTLRVTWLFRKHQRLAGG